MVQYMLYRVASQLEYSLILSQNISECITEFVTAKLVKAIIEGMVEYAELLSDLKIVMDPGSK